MDNKKKQFAVAHLEASIDVKQRTIDECVDVLVEASDAIAKAIKAGNKILICGNGGSAADSQHLAAEFVGRLSNEYLRPAIPAIALTTDSSIVTAVANDFGFDQVFSRQVEALGLTDDILVCFSTSGNSEVVLRSLEAAKRRGLKTIGFTGGSGGQLASKVDYAIVVPTASTQHVQECHLALYHIMVAIVERAVYPE